MAWIWCYNIDPWIPDKLYGNCWVVFYKKKIKIESNLNFSNLILGIDKILQKFYSGKQFVNSFIIYFL